MTTPDQSRRELLASHCASADLAAASADGGQLAASVRAALPLVAEDLVAPMTAVAVAAETDVREAATLWHAVRLEVRARRTRDGVP